MNKSNDRYKGVDLVTIRENTEGEYSGLEHEVVPGVVENLKIITQQASENVIRYAFEFAKRNNRKKITCAHKAGVMKLGDGCFLNVFKDMSKDYKNIQSEEKQVDTLCTKLARYPEKLDVMVMPNLYGDIISDLCAGLIGGLGLTASGNIGKNCAVYEAVHGTAPDIEGKGIANPTALLLSACMMLHDMGFNNEAIQIENAVTQVFAEAKWLTSDLGGKAKTSEFVQAVLDKIE